MRSFLLVSLLLLACSEAKPEPGGDPDLSSSNSQTPSGGQIPGASQTPSGGDAAALYCCTMQRFCAACGCGAAEQTIADGGNEAACRQLLDSDAFECAVGNETSALAECVSGGAGSAPTPAATTPCYEWGDGCFCKEQRRDSDVPFGGVCDESISERAICCQGEDYCNCEPVECGFSEGNPDCVCGVGVFLDTLVASCDGTASTCCTQDTGYCYCEEGCQDRFNNHTVPFCNRQTSAATCFDDEVQVLSCQ